MATITTDTFLDEGPARTAGEAMAINGGRLQIRTDTRVHAGAPANQTGTLASSTISATLGGALIIDGRNVRWLAYTGGTGTVPAIGANVRRTGVTSSYLLGVYASLTSAPTAPGAAMPTSGFIKLREVAGLFTAGALTGIGATAAGPDVVGWIEVVMRHVGLVSVPRLGQFRVRGDWFELGTTSGSASQIFQVPTNGGGADTHVPAIWIETAPGSNQYESYPAMLSTWFTASNLSTDARSKFVETMGNGQVRVGHNGTDAAGYVPPAGCRVRIPNVIGRQCVSTSDAVNAPPHPTLATRPDFSTVQSGIIDVENFLTDWYFSLTNAYRVKLKNTATFDTINLSNISGGVELDNVVNGLHLGNQPGLSVTATTSGGTLNNCKFVRGTGAAAAYAATFTTSAGFNGTGNTFGIIDSARSTSRPYNMAESSDFTFYDTTVLNGGLRIATCTNVRFYDLDYTDVLVGTTTDLLGRYVVEVMTASNDVVVDRVTFGLKGLIPNVNPYNAPFYSLGSYNVTFKNAGTPAAPLSCMSNASPAYILQDAGANVNLKVQRVYLESTRAGIWLSLATTTGLTMENLGGTVGAMTMIARNTVARGCRGASFSATAQSSVYGSHSMDLFVSDTAGILTFSFNEPTAATAGQFTNTLSENAGYTAGNQISLPTIGDEVIYEMPYFARAHLGFADTAPTLTGVLPANLSLTYDLDKGQGFSGTYKTLNAATLSAETINPAIGIRMKLRVTAINAAATTALTHVQVHTTTSLAAQRSPTALYPLGRNLKMELTDLVPGTEVVLFTADHVEIDRQVIADTTYTYRYLKEVEDAPDEGLYALVWHPDKHVHVERDIELGTVDQDININQEDDLLFDAQTVDHTTFQGAIGIQVLNPGTTHVTATELYSDWKRWIRVDNNARFPIAYNTVGGTTITGAIQIPHYLFLRNGWRIRPQEASHTLTIDGGTLVAEGDPIADTLSNFGVRVNYQQPVQAIAVGALSAQQVRDAMALSTSQSPAPGSLDAQLGKIATHTALIPALA